MTLIVVIVREVFNQELSVLVSLKLVYSVLKYQLVFLDRKLRLLTLDAIERIEVSARSILSDCMSLDDDSMSQGSLPYGPHWFMNEEFYHDKKYCPTFCSEIEKETGFTVASSLRSIPKKKETEEDPLAEALK